LLAGLLPAVKDIYDKINTNEWSVLTAILLLAFMIVVVAFVVIVETRPAADFGSVCEGSSAGAYLADSRRIFHCA
jgi:hypothetical protein